jgi:hypothetical protein
MSIRHRAMGGRYVASSILEPGAGKVCFVCTTPGQLTAGKKEPVPNSY